MSALPAPLATAAWTLDLEELFAVPVGAVYEALREAWCAGNRERWRVALLLHRVEVEQLYVLAGHRTTTAYALAALGMRQGNVCRYLVAARLFVDRPADRPSMLEWSPTTIYTRSRAADRTFRSPGRAKGRQVLMAKIRPLTLREVKRTMRRPEAPSPQHVVELVVTLTTWIERGEVELDPNLKTWLLRLKRAVDTLLG